MRRICNLKLELQPPSSSSSSVMDFADHQRHRPRSSMETPSGSSPDHQQQLTIFYNGEVCVCDVTELQARAIILLARREMAEKGKSRSSGEGEGNGDDEGISSLNCGIPSPMYSPTTGLSMKRSLQRFLQKRKHRSSATSPYHRQ